ncbi:SDR family oxidoreductase [Gordoniibacillus kamchatkensis]|uniref:SDR family oxidoreductase n=1 Tax=Gordoniibacillus kamchatkensis TaxID=1590651 RepID=UPI000B00F826|nr:SDR family oxidoreductase [Paenibacillus sp. VKM B-2647]
MSDEDWFKGVDGALGTTFRCTREVIPYMEAAGGGSIVNFASMYGIVSPDPAIYGDSGANNPANYGAGKAGVLQFTRYCAAHLASKRIRVNSITPGPFPNPAVQQNEPFLRELCRKTMAGRVGRAEDIVGPVLLLASDASAYMTGSNIVVDGGWTAW